MEANNRYHIILNPDSQFDLEIIDKIGNFMDSNVNIA